MLFFRLLHIMPLKMILKMILTLPSHQVMNILLELIFGRDVLARVVYGFRIAILFSLALLFANYSIGITLGSFMGYIGGRFDIFMQRLIEIWSNIPFLYVIIIVSSIVVPTFGMLVGIMILFGWLSMTST